MKNFAFVALALLALAGGIAVVTTLAARPALAVCSGASC